MYDSNIDAKNNDLLLNSLRSSCGHVDFQEMLRNRKETEDLRRRWKEAQQTRASALITPRGLYKSAEKETVLISSRPRRFLQRHTASNATDTPRSDSIPPEKYYTAVTLRPSKQEQEEASQKFDALNRNFVRYPNWFTERPPTSKYQVLPMDSWRNEVYKVVPKRNPVATPVRIKTPKLMEDSGPLVTMTMKTCFRPVDRLKAPPRNYFVDPEWISENSLISEARARKFMQANAV